MKRDMALIKATLKFVERIGTHRGQPLTLPDFPHYDEATVQYHADLCLQAGYIEAETTQANVFPAALTWDGQEALSALRKTN